LARTIVSYPGVGSYLDIIDTDGLIRGGGLTMLANGGYMIEGLIPMYIENKRYAPSSYNSEIGVSYINTLQKIDDNYKSRTNQLYLNTYFESSGSVIAGPGGIDKDTTSKRISPVEKTTIIGNRIAGADIMYARVVKYANGTTDEPDTDGHGSINYKAQNYSSAEAGDSNIHTTNDGMWNRKSYPEASKAGTGVYRRGDNNYLENEGSQNNKASWPDMYARVGVQDTGVGNYDKLMHNEKPDSDISYIGRDFVKVQIERVGGSATYFRGYITGLSDKWSPTWTQTSYVGRPDEMHTYEKVSRDVGFTLMILAESHKSLEMVYARLNALSRLCMPELTSAGIMKGPLAYLTVGNLFNRLPGYISSLDYDFADQFPWDIEREKPMYVSVGIGFTVIGKQMPIAGGTYY